VPEHPFAREMRFPRRGRKRSPAAATPARFSALHAAGNDARRCPQSPGSTRDPQRLFEIPRRFARHTTPTGSPPARRTPPPPLRTTLWLPTVRPLFRHRLALLDPSRISRSTVRKT
jgi:hypothetical protein